VVRPDVPPFCFSQLNKDDITICVIFKLKLTYFKFKSNVFFSYMYYFFNFFLGLLWYRSVFFFLIRNGICTVRKTRDFFLTYKEVANAKQEVTELYIKHSRFWKNFRNPLYHGFSDSFFNMKNKI